jgi:hypothetical protein
MEEKVFLKNENDLFANLSEEVRSDLLLSVEMARDVLNTSRRVHTDPPAELLNTINRIEDLRAFLLLSLVPVQIRDSFDVRSICPICGNYERPGGPLWPFLMYSNTEVPICYQCLEKYFPDDSKMIKSDNEWIKREGASEVTSEEVSEVTSGGADDLPF